MTNDLTSLEVSQRLQKAGYKAEYEFAYDEGENLLEKEEINLAGRVGLLIFPAYSTATLAEDLPDYIQGLGNLEIGSCKTNHMTMKPRKNHWWNVSYWSWDNAYTAKHNDLYLKRGDRKLIQSQTLPDALGIMLEYLLLNNLIEKKP